MPRYEYHCPAKEASFEVEHSWSESLETWGEVRQRLGIGPDATPDSSPVVRLVGAPQVLRSRFLAEPPAGEPGATAAPELGMHPIGCPCCLLPEGPGIAAFQARLRTLIERERP